MMIPERPAMALRIDVKTPTSTPGYPWNSLSYGARPRTTVSAVAGVTRGMRTPMASPQKYPRTGWRVRPASTAGVADAVDASGILCATVASSSRGSNSC